MGQILHRLIEFPNFSKNSAFLWGPRRSGKSYLVKHRYPNIPYIDLLKSDVFAEYASRPSLLRERILSRNFGSKNRFVIIDEIQKIPSLLDEVHWLIENQGVQFLLTGSSARKLRRGHANLLAGRAWRRQLHPLCLKEITHYSLEQIITSGLLPPHFLSAQPLEELRAYVHDYLKEEIAAEGAVQNLPAFSDFLRIAALSSSELLNYTNVAREVGVSTKVVRGYFQILEDTFLGHRISPWTKSKNRRMTETDKFYLFDVGVTNFLARRRPALGTPEFGKAFEHLILMELEAFRSYRSPDLEIRFWRTSTGGEVDFVLNDKEVAIEVKGSNRVHEGDLRGLTTLSGDGHVGQRMVVCYESAPRRLRDPHGKIEIVPWNIFSEALWKGELRL